MSIPSDSSGGRKARTYISPRPDWLKSDSPGRETPPASSPDWLRFESASGNVAPLQLPDWLSRVVSGESAPAPSAPPPKPPAPALPDDDDLGALRSLQQSPLDDEVEEDEAPAGDLFSSMRAATPRASVPEDLSWMKHSEPVEEEAADSAALPDWMASSESAPSGDAGASLPDWMSSSEGESKPDAAPAADPDASLPDWLSTLGEEPAPGASQTPPPAESPAEAVASDEKPTEPAPASDLPEWMAAAEQISPSDESTSLPDWLSDSGKPPGKVPGKSGLLTRLTTGELGKTPAETTPAPAEPSPAPEAAAAPDLSADWLADLEQKESEKAAAPPPIDLFGQEPASSLTLPPASPTKTPDWIAALAKEEGAELPPAPDSVSASDAPDWLDQVMKTDDSPAPDADAPKAEPPAAETPEWLDQLAGSAPEAPEAQAAEPSASAETPDWLEQLAAAPDAPKAATPEPSAATADTPDWLNQLAEAPAPDAPKAGAAEPSTPDATADTPDWLNQLAEAPAPDAPKAGAAEPSTPPASTDTPDWLNQLAEAPAADAPKAGAAEPSTPPASTDTPDWLNQLADAPAPDAPKAGAAEPSSPAPAVPADSPDWLNQLAAAPAADAPKAAAPEPAGAPEPEAAPAAAGGDDPMDFLSGMDLGMPAGAPADDSEDLLGLSGDLAPTPGRAPDEAEEPEELPDWLRTMQAAPDKPGLPAERDEALSAESLNEMDDLRFDKLVSQGEAPPAPAPEKVGALKDVVGAIRPELIFDAQTLKAGHLAADMTVTKEQSQRIQILEDLLSHKTEEVVISGPRRRALPLLRWIVVLLLVAAVAVPLAMKFTLVSEPPAPSGGPADARDILGNLAAESKVLVAFDYEPDTSAEMDTLALAILGEIARQTDSSVYAVSTRATGPALAQRAFDTTLASADKAQKDRWLNLGYIPGGPNGITTLVIGSPAGLPSALSVNALGGQSGIAETSLIELKPTLIVVLTANADDLRAWVEQAGRPTGAPMIAATSAANMPMAAPYRQSRQISALLSGVNDAVALRAATGQDADPAASSLWNSQAIGALVAALIIVAGATLYGLTALREQREQGS